MTGSILRCVIASGVAACLAVLLHQPVELLIGAGLVLALVGCEPGQARAPFPLRRVSLAPEAALRWLALATALAVVAWLALADLEDLGAATTRRQVANGLRLRLVLISLLALLIAWAPSRSMPIAVMGVLVGLLATSGQILRGELHSSASWGGVGSRDHLMIALELEALMTGLLLAAGLMTWAGCRPWRAGVLGASLVLLGVVALEVAYTGGLPRTRLWMSLLMRSTPFPRPWEGAWPPYDWLPSLLVLASGTRVLIAAAAASMALARRQARASRAQRPVVLFAVLQLPGYLARIGDVLWLQWEPMFGALPIILSWALCWASLFRLDLGWEQPFGADPSPPRGEGLPQGAQAAER